MPHIVKGQEAELRKSGVVCPVAKLGESLEQKHHSVMSGLKFLPLVLSGSSLRTSRAGASCPQLGQSSNRDTET